MDTDIDECAESCYIRHNAFKSHPLLDIVNSHHVITESRLFEHCTRIAPRLLQFFDNILERRLTDICGNILLDVNPVRKRCGADEILDRNAKVLGHLLDKGIAFWMDTRRVQRICRTAYAKEACRLLERLGTKSGYLLEFAAALERTVLVTPFDNPLGKGGTDA